MPLIICGVDAYKKIKRERQLRNRELRGSWYEKQKYFQKYIIFE